MTPTEKDAMALAVLDEWAGSCAECEGEGVRAIPASLCSIPGDFEDCDGCADIRQASAHLAARIAELEAENERAWAAANRADAKVRGWEATVVCTGLPFRACPVDGWGPGADGTVEVPALTTEKLTSILDRLARAEAELAAVRAATLKVAEEMDACAQCSPSAEFYGMRFGDVMLTLSARLTDAARGGE